MVTTVRASHPIGFRLLNRDGHSVLGIFDGHEGQMSKLEITNASRRDLKPKKPTAGEATPENHHFELMFRPGTLNLSAASQITVDEGDGGWRVSKPTETDGAVSLYLLSTRQAVLESGKTTSLTLRHLSADGTAGARGTRVELKWGQGNLEYVAGDTAQPPEPLAAGHRVQHLSVVNERGQKHIPLHVGIVGANKVLNEGGVANTLKMRITNLLNVGQGSIQLIPKNDPEHPPSEFIFSFDASDKEEWALATKSQVEHIQIKATAGAKQFTDDKKKQGQNTEWIITPPARVSLGPDEFIDVTVSNIITSLPSGQANVYVHYKNIPGYWDGDFVSVIEKGPVVYKGDKVGIGTNDPQTKLQVKGGDLRLDANREIFFEDNGQIRSLDNNHRILFRRGEDKLELREFGNIIFSPGATAGNETAKVVMLGNGNVGVGTNNPLGPLSVGDSSVVGSDGHIVLGKKKADGGARHFRIGFDDAWNFTIGDYGHSNTAGEWKPQFAIAYNAPKQSLYINSDGRVGIGTVKPLSGLSISSVKAQANSPNQEIGQLTFVGFNRGVASAAILAQSPSWDDQSHLIFKTSESGAGAHERMRITSVGRVGIGTNDPQKTLQVNGGLRVENEVSVGGGHAFEVDAPGVVGGRLKVGTNGFVGIGTANPSVALEVRNWANHDLGGGFWFAFRNEQRNARPGSHVNSISIKAAQGIQSETSFFVTSDARVKKDLKGSEPAADLDTLSRLRVTDFKYVDVATRGDGYKKGFIAQQVEEVFPQAVNKQTGVVPDIYRLATHADGWVELATDLRKGERVRLISERGEGVYEVLEVSPDKFRTDFKSEADSVFVYGREVEDFRILDYDAVAVLNVSATQQLRKEKDEEVRALRAENAELRDAGGALAKRLQLLESKLEAVLSAAGSANGSNGNGSH